MSTQSYTNPHSIRSYTDYLRVAEERGRKRRAAFNHEPDPRESRFTVYIRGANSDKENVRSSKLPSKPTSSRPSNCNWGLETVEIRATDGGCISLRPPERQSSVRPRNYFRVEENDDPFEDAPSVLDERPSPNFRLNDSLDSETSEAETIVDPPRPQMSPLPLSGTPVSLADKLVDKILRLDSARQLALLKKLETKPMFRNSRKICPISATLPVAESLEFVLAANWGDPLYVGLHSIEIFDELGRRLVVKSTEPPGAVGLFRPSSSEAPDFVTEFDDKKPPKIQAKLFRKSHISRILVTNFRSNMAALHKGVKTIEVFADETPLAHAEMPKTPLIPEDDDGGRISLTFYHPIKHRSYFGLCSDCRLHSNRYRP